jgi:hypothetical protein
MGLEFGPNPLGILASPPGDIPQKAGHDILRRILVVIVVNGLKGAERDSLSQTSPTGHVRVGKCPEKRDHFPTDSGQWTKVRHCLASL